MKPSRKISYRCNASLSIVAKIVLFGIILTGCSGAIKGSPKLPTYQATVVNTLITKYSQQDAIPIDPAKLTVEHRNRIMEDLIYLVDVNYDQFEGGLFLGRTTFDTLTDLALLGIGSAGALGSVSSTQAILAAISAGISGARVSINKNFLHEQSTHVLISTMRATRKAKLNFIRDAQTLSLVDYPMSRALGDIVDYYHAGTLIDTLENIILEAGAKERRAASLIEEKVQRKIELQFKTDPLRERIKQWLLKDPIPHVLAFRRWLEAKTPRVTISPIFWVENRETTEMELLDAILHFKINE